MTEQELLAVLKQLAQAREKRDNFLEARNNLVNAYDEKLHNDPLFAAASTGLEETKAAVEQLEEVAKRLGVDLYNANPDGGKALVGGNVNIKDTTKAEITDAVRARAWVQEFAPQMLILDEKLLIKHAKAVADTMPLNFVKITTEPVAQIASKLEFSD